MPFELPSLSFVPGDRILIAGDPNNGFLRKRFRESSLVDDFPVIVNGRIQLRDSRSGAGENSQDERHVALEQERLTGQL
jgi:hypothetical protein